ncbi:hypothetical protein [Actinoplanes sp. HUAS TT8]|uniref:hypothetical protein n=1 Tax=Actinoplanes sp. HUAS TT8 TaxID=3447453 RepID=UPI003F524EF0
MSTRSDPPRVLSTAGVTIVHRGVQPPPAEAVTAIGPEAGRHTVIVAADPPLRLSELGGLLEDRLPIGVGSIRLVLSGAGRPDVARPLADGLRREVVAPSGSVLLLPSGLLFVADGGWIAFRPGQGAEVQGSRFPAAPWEWTPDAVPRVLPGGLNARGVPAGLWLTAGGMHDVPLPAEVLSVPVDPERPTVLLGHPGEPPMDPEQALTSLAALPKAIRRRLTLLPNGLGSVVAHLIGERLAIRTGGEIDVVAGVPDTDDGVPVFTTIDAEGRRGWQPYAERVRYRAAAEPRIVAWRAPLPGGTGDQPVQRVGAGLTVEVIRAGLWLRGDENPDAEQARRVPAETQPLLVLGVAATDRVAELPGALDALAGSLPARVARSLRLVVTRPPRDGQAPGWREIVARFGPPLVVVGDGEFAVLPSADLLGTGEFAVIEPRTATTLPDEPARPAVPRAAVAVPTVVVTVPLPGGAPLLDAEGMWTLQPSADDGLPSYRGTVWTAWEPPPGGWRVGGEVITGGPADALARPDFTEPAGAVVAVWSASGRRLPGAAGHVRFPAGTRLRVLVVETGLVLLREVTSDDDSRIRVQLRRTEQARRRGTARAG